jgi:hypothetical protein
LCDLNNDNNNDDNARLKIIYIFYIVNMKEDFEYDTWEMLKELGYRLKMDWN